MYSPVGFSCKVCSYLNYNKDEDAYTCGSTEYQNHMGTEFLVREDGITKLTKEELGNYCSNWFEPAKSNIEEESKGLWANIHAKRARGEKPAKKGTEAYKKAVKAAKKIRKK